MKYKEIFYSNRYYSFYSTNKGIKLKFRFDPVPGTGGYNRLSRFYRNIKTTQERKYACDYEHIPYIRGKRSFRNLPEAWDDIIVSSNKNKRDWKKSKIKKQWMKNI